MITTEACDYLLVDNNQSFLNYASVVTAQMLGLAVTTSTREAFRTLDETNVKRVVADWDMPGTDGLRFLLDVRQRHPSIICVLITGYANRFRKEYGPDKIAALERLGIHVRDKKMHAANSELLQQLFLEPLPKPEPLDLEAAHQVLTERAAALPKALDKNDPRTQAFLDLRKSVVRSLSAGVLSGILMAGSFLTVTAGCVIVSIGMTSVAVVCFFAGTCLCVLSLAFLAYGGKGDNVP